MLENDDVVEQRIIQIVQNKNGLEIHLTNGMKILVRNNTIVDDARALYPLKKWTTIKDNKQIRRMKENRGNTN